MEKQVSHQKGMELLNSYLWSMKGTGPMTLYEKYKCPSARKRIAYTQCLSDKDSDGGIWGTVVNAGIQFFSYAYIFERNEVWHLKYITHANEYVFQIPKGIAEEMLNSKSTLHFINNYFSREREI